MSLAHSVHKKGERVRFYREGDPVVELLGSDLGNPGQSLVLLTLPLRRLSISIWGMQLLPSLRLPSRGGE